MRWTWRNVILFIILLIILAALFYIDSTGEPAFHAELATALAALCAIIGFIIGRFDGKLVNGPKDKET